VRVRLTCWNMEDIRARFTMPQYKAIEQLINRLSGSPKLQEKLDDKVPKTRLFIKQWLRRAIYP
jgi:hypothetical protein